MILHDVSHTSHCAVNSGIQRVVRKMQSSLELRTEIKPICYDPYAGYWRTLDTGEYRLVSTGTNTSFKGKQHSRWSRVQKAKGRVRRFFSSGLEAGDIGDAAFLTAEIFRPSVHKQYAKLFSTLPGPRVAIFHDAIALRLPELTPKKNCRRIPQYMLELLCFDGVAAVSEASGKDLKEFWMEQGIPDDQQPIVRTIHNATSFSNRTGIRESGQSNEVLVVSTIEGRKNHKALLEAAKMLWDEDLDFSLRLIGSLNAETGSQAHQMIGDLRNAGYPVEWNGSVSDATLNRAYQTCRFTVYPSLYEGFGLPVLESLSHGKPCVCTSYGALKEIAEPGGCLLIENGEPESIAQGMRELIRDNSRLEQLINEAKRRTFRSWDDHAGEIMAFMEELKLTHPRLLSQ